MRLSLLCNSPLFPLCETKREEILCNNFVAKCKADYAKEVFRYKFNYPQ